MHFSVAIDFTASNGSPKESESLHFIDPSGENQVKKERPKCKKKKKKLIKISLMDRGQLKNFSLCVCCLLFVCYKFALNYLLNCWSDWDNIFFYKS